jgi:hypothetical protein
MAYMENTALCPESHKKRIKTFYGQIVEFFNVNSGIMCSDI